MILNYLARLAKRKAREADDNLEITACARCEAGYPSYFVRDGVCLKCECCSVSQPGAHWAQAAILQLADEIRER